MEYVESITDDIGGGGDRQSIIHLKTGHDVFVAYGTIGVYAPGDLDRMNAGESVAPLAGWDYVDDSDAAPVDRERTYIAHTGGGAMVDVVMLRGVQEIVAPSPVCIHITDECIVYAAFDDLAHECPNGCDWGGDHSDECPLRTIGFVWLV